MKGVFDLRPEKQAETKPGGLVQDPGDQANPSPLGLSPLLLSAPLKDIACVEVFGCQDKEMALGDLDPSTSAPSHGVRSGPTRQ